MEDQTIRVMIADDIEPIRKRYIHILEKDPFIEIIGDSFDRESTVKMALDLTPDVILMDIDMDTKSAGIDATGEILKLLADTKIVILTVCEDDENVFSAFQMGVSDYVLKNSNPGEIITCVRDAYYNRSPIRPVIAEKIRMEFQRIRKNEISFLYSMQLITQLTQTEIDILDLLNKGYTRQQICEIRCVEMSTVKTQVHNILKKFDMKSMANLLKMLGELKIFDYLHNLVK